MDAFSELTPRQAGDRIVEPRLTFELVEQALHAVDRCPVSCVCSGSATINCVATGNSLFV